MIPVRDVIPSRTTPWITIGLIILNAAVFAFELGMSEQALDGVVRRYGVTAAELACGAVLFSLFLHVGWLHLVGNMLYLWVFGDNVEDRLGHGRYLAFYMTTGVAAALAHVSLTPESHTPLVGSSGAVAGVMGAHLVLFPRSKVLTFVPFLLFYELLEVPAVVFLGIWLLLPLVTSVGSRTSLVDANPALLMVAAGFIVGLGLGLVLRRPERQRVEWWHP